MERIRSRFVADALEAATHLIVFQGTDETLHGGIVMAIPRATCGDLHAVFLGRLPMRSTGVLAAAI
jgi:hypothetical protein